MKRILIISYPFPPAASVGGLRPLRMARHLPEFGYAVEVLTTAEGDGERDFDAELVKEIPPGTIVHRLPVRYFLRRNPWQVPPASQPLQRAWWKARSYATHFLAPLDWYGPWARDSRRLAEELLRSGNYHAALVTGPPFTSLVECADLGRRTGCPLVLDFRDLWTARAPRSGMAPGQAALSKKERSQRQLERRLVEAADLVIVNSSEALDLERWAFPEISPSRFACVPNAYDDVNEGLALSTAARRVVGGPVTILHTGTLAAGRFVAAANLMIAAVQLNREANDTVVRLVFAGPGEITALRELAARHHAQDIVSDTPWLSRQKSRQLQQDADVLAVLQVGSPLGLSAVPAKLYEYMPSRRWLLGVLPDGPAARIIRQEQLGEVARWDDPADILASLRRIVARVRSRDLPPVPPSKYAARETMRQLAAVLDGLTARPSKADQTNGVRPIEHTERAAIG